MKILQLQTLRCLVPTAVGVYFFLDFANSLLLEDLQVFFKEALHRNFKSTDRQQVS
jgi:hypothetical protein